MQPRFFKPSYLIVMLLLLTLMILASPPPIQADVTHCGNIGNETWAAADNVHIVTCDVTILQGATLTIEAGAIVKFQNDTQLNVNGKLMAEGTPGNEIYFTSYFDDIGGDTDGTSTPPQVGNWGYVWFNSTSDNASTISRAVIRYSGSDYGAGINDGAIYLNKASPNLSHITFTDNYINGVELAGGSWPSDTWDNTTIVYLLEEGDLTVLNSNTLTIVPGMKIKLANDRDIIVNGKLVASGTITDPIYFSSVFDDTLCGLGTFDEAICDTHNDGTVPPQVGNWGSIWFSSTSDNASTISRAVIRYSGSDYGAGINDGAIYLNKASPNLSHITFTDNYINGVELAGGSWPSDTWDNTTIVYLLEEGDLTIPAPNTLTIAPGMKIKLGNDIDFNVASQLMVSGTFTEPVYLSSVFDDTACGVGALDEAICDTHNDGTVAPQVGNWGQIRFGSGSNDDSTITGAIISYSGSDYGSSINDAAIRLNNASPTISLTTLVHNYRGIETLNGANPTLICNDIYDNNHFGIFNNGSAVTVLATDQWWGDPSGPTHADNPGGVGQSVSDGVTYNPWRLGSCLLPTLLTSFKTVDKELTTPGAVLTYTIRMNNTGPQAASNISMSDSLPPDTTYVVGSAMLEPPGTGVLIPTAGSIAWSGPVAANSSVQLTFQAAIAPDLSTDTALVNIATIDDGLDANFSRIVTTTVDVLPPSSAITDPVDSQVLTGTTYTIQGTATDEAAGVALVEVSTDGGATWQPATGTTNWTYTWTLPTAEGMYTIQARATDAVQNVELDGPEVVVMVTREGPEPTLIHMPLILK